MPSIEIHSTDDVPILAINDFIEEMNQEEVIAKSGGRLVLCSAQPPSWVTFVIESEWWVKVFGAYAAIYITEIVKEAGKDTWKNRAKVFGLISKSGNKIWEFTNKAVNFKRKLQDRTKCVIALNLGSHPLLDGAGISLSLDDPDIAVLELSIFTYHIPRLLKFIEENNLKGKAATGIYLQLLEDGSLSVAWLIRNGDSFTQHQEIIHFTFADSECSKAR